MRLYIRYIWAISIILLLTIGGLNGCQFFEKNTLFCLLTPAKTGILFENRVEENEKTNVLEYMNIYTGGGVAVGDVNNDGLMDLFFAGNQTTSRLYLNKGNWAFEDITEKAGIQTNRWCTGVTMADINADGWVDIYVCVSGNAQWATTENLLFINKKDGSFEEKAAEFGIADPRLCMHATFFDYDLDDDLDLFIITNPADQMVTGVNNVTAPQPTGERKGADILYRNDGNHHFTDVSAEAGITEDGYSLGASIADFNLDGWPDIYVSNDFLSSDIYYINQGDGTFENRVNSCFKHTSFASMGNDAADINNDGLTDLFVLDMLPEDNFRRKMLIPPTNIDKFNLAIERGFARQYTRNTLQINLGDRFSDVALLSGVEATDWSWAPLFADLDLDCDKDLLVTNGFYRDLGDMDYINYQFSQRSPMGTEAAKRSKKLADIHGLPTVPLQNYLYENLNTGQIPTFQKRSNDWGLPEKGFSNGAVYADLDNDGDLDLVMNEFNSTAKVYENRARQMEQPAHYLALKLKMDGKNPDAIGAKIRLYTPDGTVQTVENQPAHGYESSVDPRPFFGMGNHTQADSLVVDWPGGGRQVLKNIQADQVLEMKCAPNAQHPAGLAATPQQPWFGAAATLLNGIKHQENNFIDFKTQVLLPHGHARQSPALAKGDLNGDGLEDFFMSGALGGASYLFFQKTDGTDFIQKTLETACPADETDAHFFDADSDNDLDLWVVRGGSEHKEGAAELQDMLFENDGRGNFTPKQGAVPDTKSSGGCVVTGDFDKDNDLDVFIGGRVAGGAYPKAPRSYLLKNDGKGHFSDITPAYLTNAGMVSGAVVGDFNADGWLDLAITGEYMPVQILKNQQGQLEAPYSIPNTAGWWNCLRAADMDGDGDLDMLAGNLGLNSRYRAAPGKPLAVYSKDMDGNGVTEPIMVHYESNKRYIFHTRDELAAQIPAMKKRFQTYKQYAESRFEKSFRDEELEGALVLQAECFESSFFENIGQGKFVRRKLPLPAQVAPIQDFWIEDINHDTQPDVLAIGNSYETEYTTGRYDAGVGALFLGNGKGDFSHIENRKSGFWADRDARKIIPITMKNGQKWVIIANNAAELQTYVWR